MNRIYGATIMLGLVASSAVSVEAAELGGPRDEVSNAIVVVNDYVTQVRVYVEDSEGFLHQLGRVGRGKVKRFEAPADILERGDFRVRVHSLAPDWWSLHVEAPGDILQRGNFQVRVPPLAPDRWSNHAGIKTRALNVEDDETVIMWLRTDLTQSVVEVRKG